MLFAILQKYDFSSKSQPLIDSTPRGLGCLRYCKSTIFQANHNGRLGARCTRQLFAILQKYDFSSKSQRKVLSKKGRKSCLRYCKSTIFQANHNHFSKGECKRNVVCDTAKVRFFKQITTSSTLTNLCVVLFAILQKYDFSSKSQLQFSSTPFLNVVCDTAKVRFFKQITTNRYTPVIV